MGSFDSTCPVSGLAIKNRDPVAWTLIVPNRLYKPLDWPSCHVSSMYKFVMPLMTGIANDYGYIEEMDQKPLWDWLWAKFYGGFRKCKNSVSKSEDPHDIFIEAITGRQRFIPKAPAGSFLESDDEGEPFCLWMIHLEAYNFIANKIISDSWNPVDIVEQIQAESRDYVNRPERDIEFAKACKEAGPDGLTGELLERFGRGFSLAKCEFIDGIDGFLSEHLREIKDFEGFKEEFYDRLFRTALFARNMYYLRMQIVPMPNTGEQHDEYVFASEWTRKVANMAEARRVGLLEEEY